MIRHKNIDLEIFGKIIASPNKQKILYSLFNILTPKEISINTGISFPAVSKNIKELESLKVIKIKNKENKKGKIILIENKGKNIINYIIKDRSQIM